MHALITGAAGFIGSNLCLRLRAAGWRVTGLDNLSHGFRCNLVPLRRDRGFELVVGDCRDKELVRRLTRRADTVVHLAAYKIPRYGGRREMLEVNIDAAWTMMRASATVGSGHFVLASTSDIYGRNPAIPFTESSLTVLGPSRVARWAYAVSKICDEHLAWGFMEEGKLQPVVLRFFGCYGPRENRTWWGGPQAVFIERALRRQTLEIHGDGRQTRTFCYIDDLTNGIQLAMENQAARGHAWNLGGTEEISMRALGKLVWKLAAPKIKPRLKLIPYESLAHGYEDVRRRVPNLAAARATLGYRPQYSLVQGLRATIAWHQQFPR